MDVSFLSSQVNGGDISSFTLVVEHECRVRGHIYHVSSKSLADLIDIPVQLGWTSQSPVNASLVVWKSVKEGLK